jgi:hypothetical protein
LGGQAYIVAGDAVDDVPGGTRVVVTVGIHCAVRKNGEIALVHVEVPLQNHVDAVLLEDGGEGERAVCAVGARGKPGAMAKRWKEKMVRFDDGTPQAQGKRGEGRD